MSARKTRIHWAIGVLIGLLVAPLVVRAVNQKPTAQGSVHGQVDPTVLGLLDEAAKGSGHAKVAREFHGLINNGELGPFFEQLVRVAGVEPADKKPSLVKAWADSPARRGMQRHFIPVGRWEILVTLKRDGRVYDAVAAGKSDKEHLVTLRFQPKPIGRKTPGKTHSYLQVDNTRTNRIWKWQLGGKGALRAAKRQKF